MANQIQLVYVCPYGDCHKLFHDSLTFSLHLRFCRMKNAHEWLICHSNNTHIIPKLEVEFHMEICSREGREVDSFINQIRSTAMETISHTHQCELVSNPAKKQIQDDCDQIVPNIDEATEQPPLII